MTDTVYLAQRNGKRFHKKESCRYLNECPHPAEWNRAQAEDWGLKPCTACFGGEIDRTNSNNLTSRLMAADPDDVSRELTTD